VRLSEPAARKFRSRVRFPLSAAWARQVTGKSCSGFERIS
jgi:hypothetical protein